MPRSAEKLDPRKPTDVDRVVGANVRLWRIKRGLSQTDIAKRIGVTFQQVQKYERGDNRISPGRLTKIARVLVVPVMTLLGDERTLGRLRLFDRSGAYRLAFAFAAIPNRNARQRLAEMVEQIAAAMPRKRRRQRGKGRKARAR